MAAGDIPGIITLCEIVYNVLDDDDDFTSTVYDGPTIIEARADLPSASLLLKTSAHPFLMRKLVLMQYRRVRIGAGNPGYRTLLVAVRNKLLANTTIKEVFKSNVTEIDSADDPRIDGITTQKPYIGIKDSGWTVANQFGHQREEFIPVELWVFQQAFSKAAQGVLTGE